MTTKPTHAESVSPAAQFLAAVLSLGLGVGLSWAVLSLPEEAAGLSDHVAGKMDVSGVENPVTAVLLNFRSYDTLLEIGVLLLAVVGAQALIVTEAPGRPPTEFAVGPVLTGFVRLLTPLIVVASGYLLWIGSKEPGGAFQGGAILAGAVVLLLLSGKPLAPRISGGPLRFAMTVGLAVFLAVSVGVMGAGLRLLEYPLQWSAELILLMEAASALSIGLILAALFAGGRFVQPTEEDLRQLGGKSR